MEVDNKMEVKVDNKMEVKVADNIEDDDIKQLQQKIAQLAECEVSEEASIYLSGSLRYLIESVLTKAGNIVKKEEENKMDIVEEKEKDKGKIIKGKHLLKVLKDDEELSKLRIIKK